MDDSGIQVMFSFLFNFLISVVVTLGVFTL